MKKNCTNRHKKTFFFLWCWCNFFHRPLVSLSTVTTAICCSLLNQASLQSRRQYQSALEAFTWQTKRPHNTSKRFVTQEQALITLFATMTTFSSQKANSTLFQPSPLYFASLNSITQLLLELWFSSVRVSTFFTNEPSVVLCALTVVFCSLFSLVCAFHVSCVQIFQQHPQWRISRCI